MVVFTCQYCGESLQKPKVDKHYLTKCRHRIPSVTCVDCLKDFIGEDYGNHNQCVSEAERYAAHGTVFKESAGKSKQARYCEMIQNLLTSKDLTPVQSKLLSVCSNHENVPRKLRKFLNFMKNVARQVKCNENDIKSVFDILESAWQNEVKSNAVQSLNDDNPKLSTSNTCTDSLNVINNDNLQTKCDDNHKVELENVSSHEPTINGSGSGKKRKHKNENYSNNNDLLQTSVITDELNNLKTTKKQKKLKNALEETAVDNTIENEIVSDVIKFDWKGVIVRVLDSRPDKELSTKRLGKKVISEYQCVNSNHRTYEDLLPKFNKKLNKIKKLTITDGKAKLLQ